MQPNESTETDTTLSISHLNALEYCPRRFYYECVLAEFLDNAHVVEGTMLHERSDSGITTKEGEVTTFRRVWVWSERLHLSGFADVVEEQSDMLVPIEYKKGKMGDWLNDHIQLCAQALCLEEMRQCTIPQGYIFYFGTARREEVLFDATLRQQTAERIKQAFALMESKTLPPPLIKETKRRRAIPSLHPKCRDCSLEPLCLPREVLIIKKDL